MHPDEFKSLLAKLRPVIGDMADAFWLTTLLDPSQQRDIQAVAQALAAELLEENYVKRHILLEPPPRNCIKGEYTLGTVTYAGKPACPFALRESDLPQHLAILGRSGAGKTNVGYLIVWNLLRAGRPFITLDFRGTYGHFMNRPEGRDILLFTLGEEESLRFNPLEPPANLNRTQSEAYIRDVVSTVCTTYLPGHHLLSTRGVEYLILKTLDFFKMFPDKPTTFKDVRLHIERSVVDSREKDWKASAQNILFKLTTGPIGRLMNGEAPLSISDIIDRQVILELTSLGSETDRQMFSQAFLLWLYYHRLALDRIRLKPHVLIVEEAHNLFLRRHDGNSSVNDAMMRQMRGLQQSLILLDQSPSLMSVPALGNTGSVICLNLRHADDVEAAGKALTLPMGDWEQIGRLPVGCGIVKMQDRWVTPFLVRFPLFPVVSDKVTPSVRESHSPGDSLKSKVEELQLTIDEAIRALPAPDRREDKEQGISQQERNLLIDLAKHPLSVVTERYARLGWSAHTGTKIKQELLEMGLIEQEKVSVPKGNVTLLKVTEKGKELLASEGVQVQALPKNASLEHEYWKRMVAEDYRKRGYSVEEEVSIGDGKSVDLVATKDGKRIAIEVETGKSDVEGNIRKCKEAGFEHILSVTTDKYYKSES